jgi:hypothetical protein
MNRVRWFPWAFALGIGTLQLDGSITLFGTFALMLGVAGMIADRRSRRR